MMFSKLATFFRMLEDTSSRNKMTEILADMFCQVHLNEIGKICYLLQGRTVPQYEAVEFGVADKFMIKAIAKAYGARVDDVKTQFKRSGDLGLATEACYHVLKHSNTLSVHEIFEKLDTLERISGEKSQEKKITLLADILRGTDALSARYIARIPLDKLRLGFSDMTILDALSWMLSGSKAFRSKLEAAYNVRPDIGFLATTVKKDGIAGLSRVRVQVGAPILASLCARIPNADEMVEKMGQVAVEPKYDGVRVQVHFKRGAFISSFSRNLENTTAMFPELKDIGSEIIADEVIFDSEAVGYDKTQNRLIPFQETVTRKRKHGIAEASQRMPLKFFVFDILYKDGKELLLFPLRKRREILEKTLRQAQGKHLMLSPQIIAHDADEIRRFHDNQLKKGLEGAVVKKWDSPYEPGRAGFHWVKFKEEEGKTGKLTDTIDAVVMGYYRGEGKRTGFGIGAFLVGVAKGDVFVTITKIGTGVSDELWKELHDLLESIQVSKQPKQFVDIDKTLAPDVWVTPKIVVEIAGDDLTKSPTHGAEIAIRFPRLVRIRTDKRPQDATTINEVTRMYQSQKQSKL